MVGWRRVEFGLARFDVTDAEWVLIEPQLPVAAIGPLPRRMREQFNGILWQFRTGSGWHDVSELYGSWPTLVADTGASGSFTWATVPDPDSPPTATRNQVSGAKHFNGR